MRQKILFAVITCLSLFILSSCEEAKTASPKAAVSDTKLAPAKAVKAEAEEQKKEELKDDTDTSEVLISIGDKKLTSQKIGWMQPNPTKQQIADIANWWLENELLYEEAVKRGLDKAPKTRFLAELMQKRAISQELSASVKESVKITDEKIKTYYDANKNTDPRLTEPGHVSFSHIRTKTIADANAVLVRIKSGEDINAIAKELSTYRDAKEGGTVKKYTYERVKSRFGKQFFNELTAAKEGSIIGPVKVENEEAYEIARFEGKTEPNVLTFEKAKDRIRPKLLQSEKTNAFNTLLDSLKKSAADKITKSSVLTQQETPPDGNSSPDANSPTGGDGHKHG